MLECGIPKEIQRQRSQYIVHVWASSSASTHKLLNIRGSQRRLHGTVENVRYVLVPMISEVHGNELYQLIQKNPTTGIKKSLWLFEVHNVMVMGVYVSFQCKLLCVHLLTDATVPDSVFEQVSSIVAVVHGVEAGSSNRSIRLEQQSTRGLFGVLRMISSISRATFLLLTLPPLGVLIVEHSLQLSYLETGSSSRTITDLYSTQKDSQSTTIFFPPLELSVLSFV